MEVVGHVSRVVEVGVVMVGWVTMHDGLSSRLVVVVMVVKWVGEEWAYGVALVKLQPRKGVNKYVVFFVWLSTGSYRRVDVPLLR